MKDNVHRTYQNSSGLWWFKEFHAKKNCFLISVAAAMLDEEKNKGLPHYVLSLKATFY